VAVVPNGVDVHLFAELPERAAARRFLGLPADRSLIGFAGSLRPWHGLEVVVEALAELPSAVLAVAGEGDVRIGLEKRAGELGVADRVLWTEQLPHHLIPGFLAALDVAVLPYPALARFSFSPLKLYEYLAAGVPVVASDLGQIRSVLDGGRLGTLVRPGDPSALAEGIHRVLGDPIGAGEVAAAGRRVALREHSWEQRARALSDLLEGHRVHAVAG
jgi:glycosyltransferase involved in cell wall biosynthesis